MTFAQWRRRQLLLALIFAFLSLVVLPLVTFAAMRNPCAGYEPYTDSWCECMDAVNGINNTY